jgi:hypothetical protein
MDWSKLNNLQLGKYSEYLAKMEFMKHGFDVYTSEVDDKGIDLVIRAPGPKYYDIQVKSARNHNYIFFHKSKVNIYENLYAAVLLFSDKDEPDFYLIPSIAWRLPNALFTDKKYEGLKSPPEYGLNISQKNMYLLEEYRFHKTIMEL